MATVRARAGASLVAAGILVSRLAGFVRERALAHVLGNSASAGAFRAALRIPNLLQNLLGEGVLSASFIPVYARLEHEGRHEEATRVARAVGTLLGLVASLACLVGERGREVREFLDDALGADGLARSVVVCATSDAPSLVRLTSARVATAIAEWFRDAGKRVLLVMDSVTRFARAQREVGLAAGEPPARQGYPPSVFAALPRLLERTGAGERGSITALYTVLVAGSDMDEPIADEVRGILDGHIVLDRALAVRGHYPAIDVTTSLSRVMGAVATPAHRAAAARVRELVAAYEQKRELIALGAYKRGADARVDEAISKLAALEGFLRQRIDEPSTMAETISRLERL